MKKSFTLIEIILALMILSILFLAMNGVIEGLKKTKNLLKNYYFLQKQNELMVKVLYEDILNATYIKIVHSKNSDYDRLYLITSNSLYHLIYPYVLWYVSRNKNTLIRVESPFKISLPSYKLFFLDKFKKNVSLFRIYKKKGKDLIVIKANNKPIYFEMIDKDLGIEENSTKNKEVNKTKNNSDNKNESFLPTF